LDINLSPGSKRSDLGGDNLPILENLLITLQGKVDCVCIDPPYFGLRNKLSYADGVGHKSGSVSRYQAFHTFMKPRLALLKELLADDGCIWVFIDDAMLFDLRQVMNEVFGRHNFLWHVVWRKRAVGPYGIRGISRDHDFIVCYSRKPKRWAPLNIKTKSSKQKLKDDGDPRGPFYGEGLWSPKRNHIARKYVYALRQKGYFLEPPAGYAWSHPKDKVEALANDNRLYFSRSLRPHYKRFLSEQRPSAVSSLWVDQNAPFNNTAQELVFLNGAASFVFPKPLKTIERILKISTRPNSLILDCFAGTGTVGHAVLNLNREDKGHRQFILIEERPEHVEIIKKRLEFAGAKVKQDFQMLLGNKDKEL